jgi:hypothetical protein
MDQFNPISLPLPQKEEKKPIVHKEKETIFLGNYSPINENKCSSSPIISSRNQRTCSDEYKKTVLKLRCPIKTHHYKLRQDTIKNNKYIHV